LRLALRRDLIEATNCSKNRQRRSKTLENFRVFLGLAPQEAACMCRLTKDLGLPTFKYRRRIGFRGAVVARPAFRARLASGIFSTSLQRVFLRAAKSHRPGIFPV
jgi:hypothetical protein